jgi:hypothetical protein
VTARLQPGEAAGPGGSITYHVVLGNPTGRAIPLDHCPRYAQERFSIGDATHQAVNEFKLYRLNCRPVPIPAHGSVRFAMIAEMPSTDRLLPHLAGARPVVRFDFLGWAARTSRRVIRTRRGTTPATSPPSPAHSMSTSAPVSWCWWRTTPPGRRRSTGRSPIRNGS